MVHSLGLALWALLFGAVVAHEAKGQQRPHIVLVVADDLGYADLGYMGAEIRTPNIDRLAREGRTLENYYVQASCSPTRAAIQTGRYPMRFGMNIANTGLLPTGVPLDETFMSEVLKTAGYTTRAVGKWHLGRHSWAWTPAYRGYDSYFGYLTGGEDFFDHTYPDGRGLYDLLNQTKPNCGEGCATVPDELHRYSTHVFTEEAVNIIDTHNTSNPLFLYLAYQSVHAPTQAPLQFVEPYLNSSSNNGTYSYLRAVYAGMVAALDEGIGNVTRALERSGMATNTLLVFTSDNGGPTVTCATQGSNNGILKHGKCSLYQGGVRVAGFIHAGPALLPADVAGTSFKHLMHAVDWLPTFAAAAGIDTSLNLTRLPLDGRSQWDALTSNSAVDARDEVFLGLLSSLPTWTLNGAAMLADNWKLIRGIPDLPGKMLHYNNITTPRTNGAGRVVPLGEGATSMRMQMEVWEPAWESFDSAHADHVVFDSTIAAPFPPSYRLYNLTADPSELHNLAGKYPAIQKHLQQRLDAYVAQASLGRHNPSIDAACRSKVNAKDFPPYGPGGLHANWPWCNDTVRTPVAHTPTGPAAEIAI